MLTQPITIINRLGLHARAAAKLVAQATKFSSDIHLISASKTVNAKSIMGVMMLAAAKGTELTLQVDGADENEACDAIVGLVQNYFDEEG